MIFEKEGRELNLEEFERLTGAKWVSTLEFDSESIRSHIIRQCEKLYEKGELTIEQMWLGRYYEKEIREHKSPNVAIRYIDDRLGWGVFALQDLKKMQFVAEYVGKVRKRKKEDEKNGYCFEYLVAQGFKSPYTIDARDQGGYARYINHSEAPNLNSALATFDHVSHVILFAKEQVAKGTQLCYDYGSDYWSKRKAPLAL